VAVELDDDPPEDVDVDPVLGAAVVGEALAVTVSGLPYWSNGGVVANSGAPPRNWVIVWLANGSCTTSTSSLP
jgi:hypothetical protein